MLSRLPDDPVAIAAIAKQQTNPSQPARLLRGAPEGAGGDAATTAGHVERAARAVRNRSTEPIRSQSAGAACDRRVLPRIPLARGHDAIQEHSGPAAGRLLQGYPRSRSSRAHPEILGREPSAEANERRTAG